MKHFFVLLRHEMWALLINPGTYIAAFLFLIVMGFIFQDLLTALVRNPQENPPGVTFFQLFWLPVFFLVPLLTMRSLAEERRMGTLETLMTTPVTSVEVVTSKFAAAYFYYLMLWLATASFHFILYQFSRDIRLVDWGALAGGYLFVALSGLLFIALGILASALTRSQLVAGIFAFTLVFTTIIGGRYLEELVLLQEARAEWVGRVVEHLQIFQHAEDFTAGVIDSRPIVFYISGAALLIFFSILAVDLKNNRT
ncbi:MAG: hypothetical protein EA425_10765 [Puniceicoccaceae bacterium]|nr:MAG: hypothetical protein EA425_10765 [Puniceicoccaceae bacterium]